MNKRKADGTPQPCSASGVIGDRLSCLPDELIGRIISFLPTPQAVLTSQLSRRWRRVWAHVAALNVSVRDCVRRGIGPRFRAFAGEALARFPTTGIPSISVEFDSNADIAGEWYRQAMDRAVGSVRVTSLRGLNGLALPPCTQAASLAVSSPRTVLRLPGPAAPAFGKLAELSLSLVRLSDARRPLDEFLSSCCPRLRRLRLCCVSGEGVRRLALRTDVLEVLDVNNVGDLTRMDVAAASLRCLSVRSCFRFQSGGEVAVSALRIESVRWYRSYPKQLNFRDGGGTHVRRLAGLKLPALGRRDQFDAPYTIQLLQTCSLADHLDLELVVPDEMTLLNWLGPEGACEDLIQHVPQLSNVSVLSLKLRWGFGGNIGPSLASLLSRTPSLTRLHIDEGEQAAPPRRVYQWDRLHTYVDRSLRLDCLREISVDGLKGADSEEHRVMELLLGSALPSLERVSLTFPDVVASVLDEIAAEIPVHFPMATGTWDRCPSSVLRWTKLEGKSSQPRCLKKFRAN